MKMIISIFINILLMLILDTLWLKGFAGGFFAKQLEGIGRFNADGSFNVRMVAAILVYLLMGTALEVFVMQNSSINSRLDYITKGALLGLCVYGVFDLTNRAILEKYPLPMVLVDIGWGTFLFMAVAWISFELRTRVSFL